jgi:S1-C subfamily serine protease
LRVGRPEALRATLGIISSLGGEWRTGWGGRIDNAIYTDADTFSGFSGGALLTLSGRVAGINTAALNRSGNAVIPTATIKRVVGVLLEHGQIRRGYLGISTQSVKLPEAMRESLKQKAGLLVISVEENSPAAKSGLALGDTIVHFNNQAVYRPEHLMSLLDETTVGKGVSVKIARGGQLHDMTVEVGER